MDAEHIGACLLLSANENGFCSLSFSEFHLAADLPELEHLQGGGYTWHGIVDSLVRSYAPGIAQHLEYDPEGDTFVVLSQNQLALRRVAKLINDAIADSKVLEKAIAEANPDLLE